MAKVKMNPVLEQFRGQIGELIFRRHGEDVIVGRKPDLSGQTPTPAQAAARERFKLAAVYGRTALADPATKSLYEAKAKATGEPVFSITIADVYHEPSVDVIDLSGYTGKAAETIGVKAHDDFEVVGVAVRILGADGHTLEEGAATRANGDDSQWRYLTTAAIPDGDHVVIEVTASDRPGNKATKTATKP